MSVVPRPLVRDGALRRLRFGALLALALGLAGGCGDTTGPAPGAAGAAELAPLPPPPDLALECVLPTPDASWEKARAQIGGAAAFLPRSAGGLVAVTLHFPMTVSEAIDGRSPAVCAASLSNDPAAPPRFVTGVHLRWPDRLLDGLTKGGEARFDVATDPDTHIAILKARDPKDAVMAAGVLGNYLLLAAHADDLTALGPYVARTLPSRADAFPTAGVTRPAPEGAPSPASAPEPADFLARVPPAALAGPIAAAAARAWTRATDRLAEKSPIPLPFLEEARTALAALPDLDGADLRLTLGEKATRIEATAPVRKASPAEALARALPVGDLAPLFALPKDTLAAALLRRTLPTATTAPAPTSSAAAPGTPGTARASAAATTPAPTSSAAAASAAPGTPGTSVTARAAAAAAAPGTPDTSVTARAAAAAAATAPTSSAAAGSAAAAPPSSFAKLLGIADPDDAARLDGIARAFDASRGDWITAGFSFDGTGPSAFVRAAVREPGPLDAAIADLLAMADRIAPKDPVRGHRLDVMAGKTVLENIPGDVYRLRIARGLDRSKKDAAPPAAPTDTPTAVDLLFRRQDDVLVAATGYASRDVLRALLTAPAGENLRALPELTTPTARLGNDIALAAFLDPVRIAAARAGKPGSAAPAPIVLALGRTNTPTLTLFATLEAPAPAIAELTRWLDP